MHDAVYIVFAKHLGASVLSETGYPKMTGAPKLPVQVRHIS